VRYGGPHGTADGPAGRVWRTTRSGVRVTVDDGTRQCWHPDDVAAETGATQEPKPHRERPSAPTRS